MKNKQEYKDMSKYVIGLDYGSDSCRAIIADASNGNEIATSVKYYPRWIEGKYSDPKSNRYRQHPLDYIEVLEESIREALSKAPAGTAEKVVGMGFDTTGSTPVLTNKEGTPLALLPEFEENPNAMFVLWKDHTSVKEADEINNLARKWEIDYTAYEGGIYSSEWVWAKMLHILREDEKVRNAAYSWVEHCDWLPGLITGNTKPETMPRSRCAAGHKAMWHESWGGLPSEEFLVALDPLLSGFRSRLFEKTYPSDVKVGNLTKEWAERLGLSTNVSVAVGAFDCHMGAVGVEIKPGDFVRVIGTSTCDIMAVPYEEIGDKLIPGICGQVDGSVIPGMIGLEAGQSGFGDIYAWFKKVLEWPLHNILGKTDLIDDQTKEKLIEEVADAIIPELTKEAEKVPVTESTILATDWMNGRRTPDANQLLKGSITGLTLGSSAPLIFRALVEATAFGSKAIVDRFLENGIKINQIIGIGGISLKSPFVMQTMSDVLGMSIKVAKTEQSCAFGAAMFASVVAGIYDKVQDAQDAMGQGFTTTYYPIEENHKLYGELYKKYEKLGKFSEENALLQN
ncbi:MAG: ribulokinase [Fermentimonas sp.]|jgi:L-ribulokinase|nr:ribulokinase [Fermentimonas sp.]MDD2931256.1 ribulokinase [Fermentimonas sp.]MDD3189013.1 ribulokinase [Fermentimonas sp.]MDD3510750.1 ribulokinase [Fermentimonas sp.]MDD4284883.1 ribulokinase [Fermentimonas sp.]